MSPVDKQLVMFSYCSVTAFAALLIIPTLKRKVEVFSFWNFFMIGSLIFTGMSGFNAATRPHYLSYASWVYTALYAGVVVFYGSFVLTYWWVRFPRRVAGSIFRKWAPVNSKTLTAMTILSMLTGVFSFFPLPIPVLGQFLTQFGRPASVVGLTCAFFAWMHNRTNVFNIVILGLSLAATTFISTGTGGSRRFMLAALLVIPIVVYWGYLRKKSLGVTMAWLAVSAAIAVPVLMGYSAIRHSKEARGKTGVGRAVTVLSDLPKAISRGGVTEGFRGQNSIECALATIHCIYSREFSEVYQEPLFSMRFFLANPIPRAIWPQSWGEKPSSLGTRLPRDIGFLQHGNVNWGINVAGQGYYDGGLLVHLLYGTLLGLAFRLMDELLIRKSSNPFVLAVLCASCSQVVAWPRGDIAGFSLQIAAATAITLMLAWLCRVVFGAAYVDPQTSHIDNPYDAERAIQVGFWAAMLQQQQQATIAKAEGLQR